MGAATDWQQAVTEHLADHDGLILNPRRDDWDSSWEQSIENPVFREQVEWELDGLENHSNLHYFHFEAGTKSPITLMELGMMAVRDIWPQVVYCPKGFWRKGNVDILCARYGIQVHEDKDKALAHLARMVEHLTPSTLNNY